jgi:hypothetical protein
MISNINNYNLTQFNRPDTDKIFIDMINKYSNETIGVIFCGSNMFRKDLEKKCKKYSYNEKNIKFILHYEYF